MLKPKHIRQALKDKVETTVLANKEAMPDIKAAVHAIHSKTTDGKGFTTGYRASPSPTISHRISMHPGKGAGRRADRLTAQSLYSETKGLTTKLISSADASLTDKQRKAKYKIRDSELYDTQRIAQMQVKF